MSAYFKDDWKFRPDLTLNLGIHWEWYGQPYEAQRSRGSSRGRPERVHECARAPALLACDPNHQHQLHQSDTGSVCRKEFDASGCRRLICRAMTITALRRRSDLRGMCRGLAKARRYCAPDTASRMKALSATSSRWTALINTVPGINLISNGQGLTWNPPTASAGVPLTTLSNLTLPIPKPAGTPHTSPFTIQPTTGISESRRITTQTRIPRTGTLKSSARWHEHHRRNSLRRNKGNEALRRREYQRLLPESEGQCASAVRGV